MTSGREASHWLLLFALGIAVGRAMVEMVGPTNLLDFCSQKLSEFLGNAEHKHLAWLREIEEEAVKMFDSNFSAEPGLMPKTPSQKKRRRKKSSFSLREENKELSRKRLSRRRSSLKLTSSKQPLQRLQSKEGLENSTDVREGVSTPCSTAKLPAYSEAKLSVPSDAVAVMQRAEGQIPLTEIIPSNLLGQELCVKAETLETTSSTLGAISKDWSPKKTGVTELPPISAGPILVIPDPSEANEAEEAEVVSSLRIAKTSTPKSSGNGKVAAKQRPPLQDLEKEFYQDLKDSTRISPSSKLSRRSGHQSLMRRSHKSCRTSLAEKYSLAGKRENMIRKSISRAISKKKAAQESSSASSRVSCHSSIDVFMEDDPTNSIRPGLGLNAEYDETPENQQKPFFTANGSVLSSSPVALQSPWPKNPFWEEQQAGNSEECCSNKTEKPQSNKSKEQFQSAKPQEESPQIRTRSYKHAVDNLHDGQQHVDSDLSPSNDKITHSPILSSSSASKVICPLKSFLQTVQKNQLLATPESVGRNSIMKNFIRRNTPTRPDPKADKSSILRTFSTPAPYHRIIRCLVEKERQRLESLRKKEEAELQRKQKVEEEKRRRLEEMKLKREERLRKALLARERVEQIEEEKKKRREQKLFHTDEKVREEKVVEEKTKKKLGKKTGEAEARKQKVLQMEEDEYKHQELLQKRAEDEQREKGKVVLELKKLAEQRQVEQAEERDCVQQGKALHPQMQLAVLAQEEEENQRKEEKSPQELEQQQWQEKKIEQPGSIVVASTKLLNVVMKTSASSSCRGPAKGPKESKFPKVNPNNYGMDLNSDDSTDDESQPRKPIPTWANGSQLNQAVTYQYYNPPNTDLLFGVIASPKLEDIFYKNKPRYFKRTSSAVWHSPPLPVCHLFWGFFSNTEIFLILKTSITLDRGTLTGGSEAPFFTSFLRGLVVLFINSPFDRLPLRKEPTIRGKFSTWTKPDSSGNGF
ncbi:inner centromere protein-like isoform A [Alligator mississippiensis]|uniref:Inner centromere protein-like isoform A n=1 Tax=Alligator mississippiensis TaxID=8496 RepID=A0A151NXL9_ALLMI|nr:inner centromere protein-like isoform A [Alligator mississippiensis]